MFASGVSFYTNYNCITASIFLDNFGKRFQNFIFCGNLFLHMAQLFAQNMILYRQRCLFICIEILVCNTYRSTLLMQWTGWEEQCINYLRMWHRFWNCTDLVTKYFLTVSKASSSFNCNWMFKKLAKKILFPIVDFIINSANRVIKAMVKFQ